jgi:hypothetical protein
MSSFNTPVTFKQLKQLEFDEIRDPENVPSSSELNRKYIVLHTAQGLTISIT